MVEVRNAGFLQADFQTGDSITDFIYGEIKRRKPGWNANPLHFLELTAGAEFGFNLDGWDWIATDGKWTGSNCLIHNLYLNQPVSNLRMAFRFDD